MSTTSSSAVIYSFLALHQSHPGLGNPRRPSRVLSFLCKLPYAKAIPLTTWGSDSKSLNIKMFFGKAGSFFKNRYYHFTTLLWRKLMSVHILFAQVVWVFLKGTHDQGGQIQATLLGSKCYVLYTCLFYLTTFFLQYSGKLKFRQIHHTVTKTTAFDFLWLSLALYYFRPSPSLIWGAWTTRWSRQSATSWVWPFLPMIASASTFAASRKPRSGLLWWCRH